jgi:hypothetical protein
MLCLLLLMVLLMLRLLLLLLLLPLLLLLQCVLQRWRRASLWATPISQRVHLNRGTKSRR